MSDDFHKINYWTISSYAYDAGSSQKRKMLKFEQRGFLGYTCSGISRWESKQLRKWAKALDKEICVSRDIVYAGDWFVYGNKKHYSFEDRCTNIHFPKKYENDFKKFIENLPERKYVVDIVISNDHYDADKDRILKSFTKYTRNQNCHVFATCADNPNEDHLLLQFSDRETAIEFKLLVS